VFEGTYSTYQIYGFSKTISSFLSSSKIERDALAMIIHGLPETMSTSDLGSLVGDIRAFAGSLFVTGLKENYYAGFWKGWAGFAGEVAL
jgi:hypothetical protein